MKSELSDSDIQVRLERVLLSIHTACKRAGRSASDVSLIAASKLQPADRVNAFLAVAREAGIGTPAIGESYVQEYMQKRELLAGDFLVHMIGPLQSNKARDAVRFFDCIESVHSLKLAGALQKAAVALDKTVQIFLQVNISEDPAKKGFSPVELEDFLVTDFQKLDRLILSGLMTVTKLYEYPEEARTDFRALRNFRDKLQALPLLGERQLGLSMGMSADYEIAIEEGATVVRVGSAIFGDRLG